MTGPLQPWLEQHATIEKAQMAPGRPETLMWELYGKDKQITDDTKWMLLDRVTALVSHDLDLRMPAGQSDKYLPVAQDAPGHDVTHILLPVRTVAELSEKTQASMVALLEHARSFDAGNRTVTAALNTALSELDLPRAPAFRFYPSKRDTTYSFHADGRDFPLTNKNARWAIDIPRDAFASPLQRPKHRGPFTKAEAELTRPLAAALSAFVPAASGETEHQARSVSIPGSARRVQVYVSSTRIPENEAAVTVLFNEGAARRAIDMMRDPAGREQLASALTEPERFIAHVAGRSPRTR